MRLNIKLRSWLPSRNWRSLRMPATSGPSRTTHECPVDGCRARVGHDKLMCLKHWRMVPADMGFELYSAYYDRPLSDRHQAAMRACIDHVNARMNERQGK